MSNTPLTQINHVYFKREDLNRTGSVKDRALPFQINNLIKLKFNSAVISSTGNAAISAKHFCHQKKIPLTIFTSRSINPDKLKLLNTVQFSQKPISAAIKFAKANYAYLLRQSTDHSALLGYQQLGKEILEQLPQVTSIYLPVGSGTTLLGLSQAIPNSVKLFAVQPATNPSLAKFWQKSYSPETQTITDALSVKALPLKDQLIDAINLHQGQGIIVQNQDIINAQKYLNQYQLPCSAETALAYAGFIQTKKIAGAFPVIIATGTKR